MKFLEPSSVQDELLKNKCSCVDEDMALGKIFAVKNFTEQRNIVTAIHTINCKWENKAKKIEVSFERELSCTQVRQTVNILHKIGKF